MVTQPLAVHCDACGQDALSRREKMSVGHVVLGTLATTFGGFAYAWYHMRWGDAVCGYCGREGPFSAARGPATTQKDPKARGRAVGRFIGAYLLFGILTLLPILALVGEDPSTGALIGAGVFWLAAITIALRSAAKRRRARVAAIQALQQAPVVTPPVPAAPSPAAVPAPAPRPIAPPRPAAPPTPSVSPGRAKAVRERAAAMQAAHPKFRGLVEDVQRAIDAGSVTQAEAALDKIGTMLAEREALASRSREVAQKMGQLSERFAERELSPSAFQAARTHLEREAARTDERLHSLDADLFRE